MPTQQEIEYNRDKFQRMNRERFFAANIVALITHTITQPLDLLKVRAQMLQEGKVFNGIGLQRGYNAYQMYDEISKAGGGYKTWYTNYEGFFSRTIAYTTWRVWAYLYFLDKLNSDPRRYARPDTQAYAGIAGGLIAGVVTNPIEIVYTRMQVDDLYPEKYKRNYTSFYDGLVKTAQEGALFRGSVANGWRIAGLITGTFAIHDWFKENFYYFLGSNPANRFVATAFATTLITLASMPFDTIRVRQYTQRPLPNGVWPYAGFLDCLSKITRYEANPKNHGNLQAFLAGAYCYWARYFVIFYASQYILDFYHRGHFTEEYWHPATYTSPSAIAYNVYDPFTLAYHKGFVGRVTEDIEETAGLTRDHKPLNVV